MTKDSLKRPWQVYESFKVNGDHEIWSFNEPFLIAKTKNLEFAKHIVSCVNMMAGGILEILKRVYLEELNYERLDKQTFEDLKELVLKMGDENVTRGRDYRL